MPRVRHVASDPVARSGQTRLGTRPGAAGRVGLARVARRPETGR